MLTIQQIITEADILVPNVLSTADKVSQLNAINNDFFTVVKIPKLARFVGIQGQIDYVLPNDVRAKNVDLVKCGLLQYRDLQTDGVLPVHNNYSFDDSSHILTLSPAPYQNGLQGICRYHWIATTTFTNSSLNAYPDAPAEYHWTYVPALAAWMANTQDDGVKAAILADQYKAAWNVAAQNYRKE